jgi:ABC-type dipeptide/oligopeptide/nickel transport system permease component
MTQHLLRRLAGSAGVLLAVSLVIFAALDATPGDAADALVGDSASQVQLDALRREMGLDLPWTSRYVSFVTELLTQGSLGRSLISGRPVTDLLAASFPYTAVLALAAILLATGVGIVVGTAAAVRAGAWLDTAIMGVTALGMAVPTFWSGLLFILVFSLGLGWLPVVGAGSLKHLVLPTLTLALPTAAVVARLMRSSVLDELTRYYVRTARAKGAPPRRVLLRHVLRNSFIPLLTLLGLHLGHLLGGAFIVETIFGWPGLGRLTVQAIFDRDQPVVLGAALTVATVYLLINLAVDLLHARLDPRVGHATL